MDPVSEFVFTFETVDDRPHPDYIIENLTEKGPIFLAFRADVCSACEIMEPILMEIFDVEFGKKELFYDIINYKGDDIVFYHINIDDPYEKETEGFYIYDKDQRGGVPMFVFITLGNNSGSIEPYYITAYSTLGKEAEEERVAYFDEMISVGLEFYKKNK
jgi:thiol-disulfide isomerase/thioredoxin